MLPEIIESERALDALLPLNRLEQSPSAELLDAVRSWSQAIWVLAEQSGKMPLSAEEIKHGIDLSQNPVFICGVHRSGTTLVRDILDGHPSLVVLPSEGTFYTNLEAKLKIIPNGEQAMFLGMEWLRRLANPINQPPYWLLGRSSATGSPYIEFARYLMAWWIVVNRANSQWPHIAVVLAYASCTGGSAAKLWVDKTPTNERFLKRIWQEMPNAKIIHVIREPMATLSSRKKMDLRFNIRSVLRDLKKSYQVALEHKTDNERFLLVRYEELCKHPERGSEHLASFLGIENSASLSKPTVAGMPSHANSSFNRQPVPGHILKPGQHRQDELLNVTESRLLTACIGNLAAKLNYATLPTSYLLKLYLLLKNGLL